MTDAGIVFFRTVSEREPIPDEVGFEDVDSDSRIGVRPPMWLSADRTTRGKSTSSATSSGSKLVLLVLEPCDPVVVVPRRVLGWLRLVDMLT